MNIREGQPIVSKDRAFIVAYWNVNIDQPRGCKSYQWSRIDDYDFRVDGGIPSVTEHEVVVDYDAAGITIWRYTGDDPEGAFMNDNRFRI